MPQDDGSSTDPNRAPNFDPVKAVPRPVVGGRDDVVYEVITMVDHSGGSMVLRNFVIRADDGSVWVPEPGGLEQLGTVLGDVPIGHVAVEFADVVGNPRRAPGSVYAASAHTWGEISSNPGVRAVAEQIGAIDEDFVAPTQWRSPAARSGRTPKDLYQEITMVERYGSHFIPRTYVVVPRERQLWRRDTDRATGKSRMTRLGTVLAGQDLADLEARANSAEYGDIGPTSFSYSDPSGLVHRVPGSFESATRVGRAQLNDPTVRAVARAVGAMPALSMSR